MLPPLNDEIIRQQDGTTYPAYVYSRSGLGTAEYGAVEGQPDVFAGFTLTETLQAIVAPGTSWQINDSVEWDGAPYVVSQVAHRKDMDGEPHHTTVTFQQPE